MLAFLYLLMIAEAVSVVDINYACEDGGSMNLLQSGLQLDKVVAPHAPLNSQGGLQDKAQGASGSPFIEYPYSQRGRDYTTSSYTPVTGPTNLAKPTWIWSNPDDEQVRHSPLIDNNKDIYVQTGWKIRKFKSDADSHGNPQILWTVDTGHMDAAPVLYQGALYAVAHSPDLAPKPYISLLSIDMDAGTVLLNKTIYRKTDGDASSVFVYNNTVLFAVTPDATDAPSIHNVYAADATDGHQLWEFAPDDSLWNFAPSSRDGTILFAGSCGRAYQITFEGTLLWKNGPASTGMCGTGGGATGPNGVFYNVFNRPDSETAKSLISARNITTGDVLWTHEFHTTSKTLGKDGLTKTEPKLGNQYPAVGMIGNTLAVVAGVGGGLSPMPESFPLSKDLYLPNAVVAMDAASGKEIWRYDEPTWPHLMAAGDDDMARRQLKKAINPKTDVMCLPDPQGIPLIAGDGTVYMSSSHGGELRAIKDKNGDGKIDPSEVSSFSTHNCFLNSPSLAQGMLVAAPCWGPMYVFKE